MSLFTSNNIFAYNIFIVLFKGIFIILFFYNLAILVTLICANTQSVILNTAGISISTFIIIIYLILEIDTFFSTSIFMENFINNIFLSVYLYYSYDSYTSDKILTNANFPYIFAICIISIVFLFNIYLYKKRKSEDTNKFFVFTKAKSFLKSYYSIIFGCTVFIFVASIFNVNLISYNNNYYYYNYLDFIICLIITGFFMLAFYCILEFIATKNIKEIMRSIKIFPISFLIVTISLLFFCADIFNIKYYFPNQNNIKSYSLFHLEYRNNDINTFSEPENLEKIKKYFDKIKETSSINNINDSTSLSKIMLSYNKLI